MDEKPVVVTGVNGHLGNNLARELLESGYRVRGTVRSLAKGERAKTHDKTKDRLELVVADVLEQEGWDEVMADAAGLFHTATIYSTTADAEVILNTANIGTENVFSAAARAGIKRVVYTSSIAAVGSVPKGVKKDETYWNDNDVLPYSQGKTESERLAWRMAEELGLDLRVINPAGILGGGFDKPTPSVDFIEEAIKGKFPMAPKFPMSFVHVDDVAKAHRLAYERDGAAGRYLLAPHDGVTIADVLRRVKELYPETKAPTKSMPNWMIPVAVFRDWIMGLFGAERRITRAVVKRFKKGDALYDSSKAERDLGITWKSFDDCVRDTVDEFLSRTQ